VAGTLKEKCQSALFFEKSTRLGDFLAIGAKIRAALEGTAASHATGSHDL
jgi:hypothetical protein